jgi:hypothetical protein
LLIILTFCICPLLPHPIQRSLNHALGAVTGVMFCFDMSVSVHEMVSKAHDYPGFAFVFG